MSRIYLSPPHMGGMELRLVEDAFASNWIAPLGPHVDALEREVAALVQVGHAAALASGTAALHLALKLVGVERGDEVVCPTLTFSASANPICYEGARPVFVDVERETWGLDPARLAAVLQAAAERGKLPRAVIAVDLYGRGANYDRLLPLCEAYGVPLVEDAAEALGANHHGRPLGGMGRCGIFSFNGNKIISRVR